MHTTANAITALDAADLDTVSRLAPPEHPTTVLIGRGALGELRFEDLGTVILVGTRGSISRNRLDQSDVQNKRLHIFDRVEPNPTPAVIDACATMAQQLRADTIVGIGGGSSLDTARCVALMHATDNGVRGLQQTLVDAPTRSRDRRLVQVPTTAGTGSEVTPFAAVWYEDGTKSSVDHPSGFADIAVVDPTLTDSMPPRLTAAVGLDAMAHAIEAIWGRHSDPLAVQYAARALELIHRHLLGCVRAPSQRDRNGVSLAATLAGLALARSRSAIAHALSYGLTGRYGIDHGIAVGMLCRAALPFVLTDAPEQVGTIVKAFGQSKPLAVQAFINEVFLAANLAPTLSGWSVPQEAFRQIAQQALDSNRLANTAGIWDRARLVEMLDTLA